MKLMIASDIHGSAKHCQMLIITAKELIKYMAEAVKESVYEIGKEYPEISELLHGMTIATLKAIVEQEADAIFDNEGR